MQEHVSPSKPKRPKTGGRKKGVKNKRTLVLERMVQQVKREAKIDGTHPQDYLMKVLNDPTESKERKMDAAKTLMPYTCARLNAIDMSNSSTTSHEELIKELE